MYRGLPGTTAATTDVSVWTPRSTTTDVMPGNSPSDIVLPIINTIIFLGGIIIVLYLREQMPRVFGSPVLLHSAE
jgi:hypothetical protein